MTFDGFDPDTENLSADDSELALVVYDRRLRDKVNPAQGEYEYWECAREHANKILAFIEIEGLDAPYFDEPPYDSHQFKLWYRIFDQRLARYTSRISLARSRGIGPDVVSAVRLNEDCRAEIHGLLDRIRKVVGGMDLAEDKRNNIYTKIAKLHAAIDTSMTSVATFNYHLHEITTGIGEAARNLEPLAKLIEHIRKSFGSAMDDQKQGKLSPPPEQPMLPSPTDIDDEIPF